MAKAKKEKKPKKKRVLADRYGIGEWFGVPIHTLTDDKRQSFAKAALYKDNEPIPLCPFVSGFAKANVKCSKKGGVCTFAPYQAPDPEAELPAAIRAGLTAFCPNRFYEGATAFRAIGERVLGTTNIGLAKEVDFLTSTTTGEAAGSIDWVLFDLKNRKNWCALEFQAVYFSGGGMTSDFTAYLTASGLVFPTKTRRPDFRSSGPKRLMPQLMIKVPTLRRWGKRCAVVVDTEFFKAMGEIRTVNHISNCDIVWFVVGYTAEHKLELRQVVYSTLESSVEGLTGGVPVPLPVFEERLLAKPQFSLEDSATSPAVES